MFRRELKKATYIKSYSLHRINCLIRLLMFAGIIFIGCVSSVRAGFDEYALTQGYYSELDDLDAAVKKEFGPGAEVADWEDIKQEFSGEIAAFCDAVGLVNYRDNAMCYRNGQKWWSSSRHYFVERHNGNVPGGWLVHSHINNHTLDLGSWYGLNQRIIARVLPGPTLTINPDPLFADQYATFTVTQGNPTTVTYLAYSLNGSGSTYVSFLDVTLDLFNPKQANVGKISDSQGTAIWVVFVPATSVGYSVWFQAAQYSMVTNVVATSIQ